MKSLFVNQALVIVFLVALLDIFLHAVGGADDYVGQSLIANGLTASIENYPWHVGVYRQTSGENNYDQKCGGTLISTKYVISAAHCFWDVNSKKVRSKDFYKIALGKFTRDWQIEDLGEQRVNIAELIVQRQYRDAIGNYQYDIAVVRLEEEVTLSNIIKPVSVDWTNELEQSQLVAGQIGTLVGWGRTLNGTPSEELLSVELPYVSADDCLDTIAEAALHLVTSDKFCAGYTNRNISACPGDSGGGLVFYDITSNRYYLRGVVSIAFTPKTNRGDLCYAQQVTAFTSLADPRTLKWVQENTGRLRENTTAVVAPVVRGYRLYADANRYYKLYKTPKTWTEAKDFCPRQGTNIRLAMPTTLPQYQALGELNRGENNGGRMWVGMSDRATEGEFKTVTGELVSTLPYFRWNNDKPNNGGWLKWNEENCVQFSGPKNDEKINDVDCDIQMVFVCEK